MSKVKTIVSTGMVLALLTVMMGCAAQPPTLPPPTTPLSNEKLSFSIATGSMGGTWYPLGGAISGIINNNVPNTQATAEASNGAIDNLKLLTAGKVGMALAQDYHGIWANEGKLPGLTGKHNVRAILSFSENPVHVITTSRTGIKSLGDLKGKRVSTGAPNSGVEEVAGYVLQAAGIDWNKDIIREKLGPGESIAALKEGKIDAFLYTTAAPASPIIDLASTPGLNMVLLPLSGEMADKIMAANPGALHKAVIPKGTYTGVNSDIETLANTSVLYTMDSFPEDRVYLILKAIFANLQDLVLVSKDLASLTPELSIEQINPALLPYLHPGAVRFFKEMGALK